MKKNKPKVGNDLLPKKNATWGSFKRNLTPYSTDKRFIECEAKVSVTYNGKCEDCTDYFD